LAGAWQAAAADSDAEQALVLQSDVTSMTVRLWQGTGGWQLATGAAPVASAPLPAAVAGFPAASSTPTGLEVSLQLRGRTTSMLKVFLVGAV
ncbi:MAG: type II secretory pathway component PulJ, partial [Herminiimonas sp.]|nr:type II secretory pathway component PulJ [Herminiimonas sp.]